MNGNDMDVIDIKSVRKSLTDFQFNKLFIEDLGWDDPCDRKNDSIEIQKEKIFFSYIAEIKSIPIIFFDKEYWAKFKEKRERKNLHKKIESKHAKNLVIFSDKKEFFSLSYLPNSNDIRIHDYFKGQNGDAIIAKLAGIHIGIDEREPSISQISKKIDDSFNTEKVTDKFYKDFKSGHIDFQKYITGIETEQEKAWYSSVVLNRLMFIWFLQKKGFLKDKNNNPDFDYLKTKFQECKSNKQDYYLYFLELLFFQGFAKKPQERSDEAKRVLGNIKYLNGGLFVPHSIEEKYRNKIKIKSKAFEKIFEIFGQYDWQW